MVIQSHGCCWKYLKIMAGIDLHINTIKPVVSRLKEPLRLYFLMVANKWHPPINLFKIPASNIVQAKLPFLELSWRKYYTGYNTNARIYFPERHLNVHAHFVQSCNSIQNRIVNVPDFYPLRVFRAQVSFLGGMVYGYILALFFPIIYIMLNKEIKLQGRTRIDSALLNVFPENPVRTPFPFFGVAPYSFPGSLFHLC